MPERMRTLAVAWVLATGAASACAQAGIYTCVDGRGRRITSDRPIVDCLDREQRQLNGSGTTRRTLGPTLSPREQGLEDEKARLRAEERQREADEKRREHALLARYPSQREHDAERTKALQGVEDVIAAASARLRELSQERDRLARDGGGRKDPRSQRMLQELEHHIEAQERFLANQQQEKQRINARFDDELARLRAAWAQAPR